MSEEVPIDKAFQQNMQNFIEIKDILDIYNKCIETITKRVVELEVRVKELEEK